MQPRIAVIGGGISGLAAAHHVLTLAPHVHVVLLEAGSRLGGVISTKRQHGFLLESAADGFLTRQPAALQLCARLGLEQELIRPQLRGSAAMVVCRGKLKPVPRGFMVMAPSAIWPMITTTILSPWGKLRAGLEPLIAAQGDADESVQSFVCRRFGRQVYERLVQPLTGSIYAAEGDKLSVAATMPQMLELERKYGSVLRGMLRNKASGEGGPPFASLRSGMGALIEALVERLPPGQIHLNAPVTDIAPALQGGWSIRVDDAQRSEIHADGVIVAAPARHAADMLAGVDSRLASELGAIEYASGALVYLAYPRRQIKDELDSFGFVVPLRENRSILACSYSSRKYAGRSPRDQVLFRVFIGGCCQAELLRLSDPELIDLADRELRSLLRIDGPASFHHVIWQRNAFPQYHVGHVERVERINKLLQRFPSLALAGSGLSGMGIPGCIASGQRAAAKVAYSLKALHQQSVNRAIN